MPLFAQCSHSKRLCLPVTSIWLSTPRRETKPSRFLMWRLVMARTARLHLFTARWQMPTRLLLPTTSSVSSRRSRLLLSSSWLVRQICVEVSWTVRTSRTSSTPFATSRAMSRVSCSTMWMSARMLHQMVATTSMSVWLSVVEMCLSHTWRSSWRRQSSTRTWIWNTRLRTGKDSRNWWASQTCRTRTSSFVCFPCIRTQNSASVKFAM